MWLHLPVEGDAPPWLLPVDVSNSTDLLSPLLAGAYVSSMVGARFPNLTISVGESLAVGVNTLLVDGSGAVTLSFGMAGNQTDVAMNESLSLSLAVLCDTPPSGSLCFLPADPDAVVPELNNTIVVVATTSWCPAHPLVIGRSSARLRN